MRHRSAGRKFNRSSSHRDMMFRNLMVALIKHESIETTLAKAKDLRKIADRMVTLAGEGSLHARRQAYSYLPDKAVVHKLFAEIGPRFKDRNGGYTRVLRTRVRPGDAAEMALIEFVEKGTPALGTTPAKQPEKKKAAKSAKAAAPAKAKKESKEPKKEPKKAKAAAASTEKPKKAAKSKKATKKEK